MSTFRMLAKPTRDRSGKVVPDGAFLRRGSGVCFEVGLTLYVRWLVASVGGHNRSPIAHSCPPYRNRVEASCDASYRQSRQSHLPCQEKPRSRLPRKQATVPSIAIPTYHKLITIDPAPHLFRRSCPLRRYCLYYPNLSTPAA